MIGDRECYDYIVASHVIEHVPDMLGFLKECDVLLKPKGVLFLAVPDKRRCFDVFRPLASTSDVMQAHHEQRRVHTPARAFDHVANLASLDTKQGWSAGARGTLRTQHPLSFAHGVFKRATRSQEYFDFHAWVFTPSSFRLILRDLNEIDVLGLRECAFRPAEGIEFYVTLSRSGHGCPSDRLTLLQAVQEELREHPQTRPIETIPDVGVPDRSGCVQGPSSGDDEGV